MWNRLNTSLEHVPTVSNRSMCTSIVSSDRIGDVVVATFGLLERGLPLHPFKCGDGYGRKNVLFATYVPGSRGSEKPLVWTKERRNELSRRYAIHGSPTVCPTRLASPSSPHRPGWAMLMQPCGLRAHGQASSHEEWFQGRNDP